MMLVHFHMVLLGALPAMRLSVMRVLRASMNEMKRAISAYGMAYQIKDSQFTIEAHRCDHMTEDGSKSAVTRSGNRYGRYGKCTRCGRRWTYNDKEKTWEITHEGGSSRSKGSSASCSRLPPPSSADTRTASSVQTKGKSTKGYIDPTPKRASTSSHPHRELRQEDLQPVIPIYTDEEEEMMCSEVEEDEESYSWSDEELVNEEEWDDVP